MRRKRGKQIKGQRNGKTVVKEQFNRKLDEGRTTTGRTNKRDRKAARKKLGKLMKMRKGYWRGTNTLFFTSLL
jgi:hypothetical protein